MGTSVSKIIEPKVFTADADWAKRLIMVCDEFRKLNPDITVSQVRIFLEVGLRPNSTQRDICRETGVSDGTVSRILAVLSDRGRGDVPGKGVISIEAAPDNYRSRVQNLTAKGRHVWSSLRNYMTR